MARPIKPIDDEQLMKLAAMHCSVGEIAAFFDVSRDTIERRYAAEISKGREMGKSKLRRLQWQSAEKGNVVMQIFLGKQYLGQSDKVELDKVEHTQDASKDSTINRLVELIVKEKK